MGGSSLRQTIPSDTFLAVTVHTVGTFGKFLTVFDLKDKVGKIGYFVLLKNPMKIPNPTMS